ncbi:NADPH:adrenodoxin mitochondrial-like [Raphidocelis subcapitata]|uniref:NADPH:adrenodoxin oxidoreductase, mitochondrial n=1 Tax=Raphidocelis subcapitata TaxID=307507 RepID=A0A2V0NMB6_9CHLO|nr:NADPH:adrenodoxin mitochondrial-like [Raphidocelis subcapitata]|eukprot:GBF88624.1 NADPH:adrenodoxin mitochondrial-like [Raphidocelis subcapitata]
MLPRAGARLLSTAARNSVLQVCIVGSGPAGLYTAEKLLKRYGEDVRVDVLDRLPTPFGLVRSGVAPDHADVKNVTNQFTATCRDPRVGYLGNVSVGADIALAELRPLYHAVVLAYGAESDRRLGVPGEDAAGVFAAREFVWWYNGHPDARDLPVSLADVESVAVCGIGNVALDCARLLLKRPAALATTDIAGHALDALRKAGRVREVQLFARRGPVQAACTPKELRELVTLDGVAVHAPPDQMAVSPADEAEMKAVRMRRRMYDLIKGAAAKQPAGAQQHLRFQFYRNPVEVMVDPSGAACGVRVERTRLEATPRGVVAVGTGEYDAHPAQLVLKSIGYRSLPLEGVAFDARAGVVPNTAGRVLREYGGSEVDPGLYVCGWVKRGPTGIIGTNSMDADETVDSMYRDTAALPLRPVGGGAALRELLRQRGVRAVDFGGWQRIDAREVAGGAAVGKPREKIVSVGDMLSTAGV